MERGRGSRCWLDSGPILGLLAERFRGGRFWLKEVQILWNLDIVGRGSRIFTACLVRHFGAANGGSPSPAKIDSGHKAQRYLFGKIQHWNKQVESEPKTSYMTVVGGGKKGKKIGGKWRLRGSAAWRKKLRQQKKLLFGPFLKSLSFWDYW